MKVVIHDYAGHPFAIDLSRRLAMHGHQVRHLYAEHNITPRGTLQLLNSDPPGLSFNPVPMDAPVDKRNFFRRWLGEWDYGKLAAKEILKFEPDVVLCGNTPLDAVAPIMHAASVQDAAFVFWLQDLLGVAARQVLSSRLPVVGSLIGRYYETMEKRLLSQSDAVVPIGEEFLPVLRSWGIHRSNIRVIPNWAPIEQLPVMPRANPWAIENGLSDGFRFVYTGTLGLKHDPMALIDLATHYDGDRIYGEVVVVSEGAGMDWLKQERRRLGLKNLRLFGFQPMDRYAEVLASADVLVALLGIDAGTYSIPSKVLSYLCAARPILLAVPEGNLASRIVQEENAGIVVAPDDLDGFLRGAHELMANGQLRQRMGDNGRRYAEEHFDIERITNRFEELLFSI